MSLIRLVRAKDHAILVWKSQLPMEDPKTDDDVTAEDFLSFAHHQLIQRIRIICRAVVETDEAELVHSMIH